MSDVAMLSPSKATDLRDYLRGYPEWPLRVDLLIDFVMHSQLVIPQPGVPIFVERDIEHFRWKRAFEDLITAGAISLPEMDYPSQEEEGALLGLDLSGRRIGAPLDFALTIRHALRQEIPVKYRPSDVSLLQQGEDILNEVYTQWGFRADSNQATETESADLSRVATWLFRIQLPRIAAKRDHEAEDQLVQYLGWQPNQAVWIKPDDLAGLLKDRESLDQFRAHAQEIARRGYDDLQTGAYVAGQRYAMEKRLKILDVTLEGADLFLELVPLPIKILVKIAARLLAPKQIRSPYRWLLATSEVDAKAH
jgi:hypothetical protein